MELDRALELAVASSWEDLVKPGERCSVHIEYKNSVDTPISSVEVWTIRNRGYGTLVCRYFVARADGSSLSSERPGVHFANSYGSKALADGLGFIMRNQGRFTRLPDRSVHGLVQIDCPSEEDRSDAATWSQAVHTELSETVWN
jgi:hypothetical protein